MMAIDPMEMDTDTMLHRFSEERPPDFRPYCHRVDGGYMVPLSVAEVIEWLADRPTMWHYDDKLGRVVVIMVEGATVAIVSGGEQQ